MSSLYNTSHEKHKGGLHVDVNKTTQNHVSYIYSKEVILKSLLEKGIITDDDFSRYDQILYDRYHIDASLGVPRPKIKEVPEINGPTALLQDSTYLSLTALAKAKDSSSPGYLIQTWLREARTIEFLRIWELQNNPNFNDTGYHDLMKDLNTSPTTFTTKKWVKATDAIGIQSKAGKTGGTYAHPEIFCHFKAWLFPEFQHTLIQNYMRSSNNREDSPS